MKFKKILLSLLICLSCFVQAKNITISRLTCEMQEGLVVVEGSPDRKSTRLNSSHNA